MRLWSLVLGPWWRVPSPCRLSPAWDQPQASPTSVEHRTDPLRTKDQGLRTNSEDRTVPATGPEENPRHPPHLRPGEVLWLRGPRPRGRRRVGIAPRCRLACEPRAQTTP